MRAAGATTWIAGAVLLGCGDFEPTNVVEDPLMAPPRPHGEPAQITFLPFDLAPNRDPFEDAERIELLQSGFLYASGPVWSAEHGLLVTDEPDNVIWALRGPGEAARWSAPSRGAFGLALDATGRLYATEHHARAVTRTTPAGGREVLATHFGGKRLNAPHDLVLASDGSVYFTDPGWGIYRTPAARQLSFNGIFRIAPDGELSLEHAFAWAGHGNTPRPNGIALSTNERWLYVSDDHGDRVLVFPRAEDGHLGALAAEWPTERFPMGLAVDARGWLYVASYSGVAALSPRGEQLGFYALPRTSNLAFGDEDGASLYVTASDAAHRLRLRGL